MLSHILKLYSPTFTARGLIEKLYCIDWTVVFDSFTLPIKSEDRMCSQYCIFTTNRLTLHCRKDGQNKDISLHTILSFLVASNVSSANAESFRSCPADGDTSEGDSRLEAVVLLPCSSLREERMLMLTGKKSRRAAGSAARYPAAEGRRQQQKRPDYLQRFN